MNFKKLLLFDLDQTIELKNKSNQTFFNRLNLLKKENYDLGYVSIHDLKEVKLQNDLLLNNKLFDFIFLENGCILYKFNRIDYEIRIQDWLDLKTINIIKWAISSFLETKDYPKQNISKIEIRKGSIYVALPGLNCSANIINEFIEYDKNNNLRNEFINYLISILNKYQIQIKFCNEIGVIIFPINWDKKICANYLKSYNYDQIFILGNSESRDRIYLDNSIIGFDVNINLEPMIDKLFLNQTGLDWKNIIGTNSIVKPIDWNLIEPIIDILDYETLINSQVNLNEIIIVKLNGGLGTTMNCKGPKSIITVKNGLTFLEIIINQVRFINNKYNVNIPLILMNSTSTNSDPTMNKIIQNNKDVEILIIIQECFPRLLSNNEPVNFKDSKLNLSPSGTGTLFDTLIKSPIYFDLIKKNKKYLFISNSDNLNATLDLKILNYLQTSKLDLIIEVTEKTNADVKGGTIINYNKKKLMLELPMVPEDKISEFCSIDKFTIFNTNNIWISLNSLASPLDIKFLKNKKIIEEKEIYQLEGIIGSVLDSIYNSKILKVKRDRFTPVKKFSDLENIKSDKFILNSEFRLEPSLIDSSDHENIC